LRPLAHELGTTEEPAAPPAVVVVVGPVVVVVVSSPFDGDGEVVDDGGHDGVVVVLGGEDGGVVVVVDVVVVGPQVGEVVVVVGEVGLGLVGPGDEELPLPPGRGRCVPGLGAATPPGAAPPGRIAASSAGLTGVLGSGVVPFLYASAQISTVVT
jgi:hypothetical protein